MDDAAHTLRQYWGYERFRPGQEKVIGSVLAGRDVLAILPTGGGKSVCYQVPALLSEGLTLVISPLIALMQDQVAHLSARGIPAAFINSTLSRREIDQRWTNAEHGQYRLLYVAPERVSSDLFQARAERLSIALLAVDEAHCISEWGHQFRPAYRELAEARQVMGDPPTIAVTATATPEVRSDIVEQLDLDDPAVIVSGFDRPNIIWSVFQEESKQRKVAEIVDAVPGAGIVYTATRRDVEGWTHWLGEQGVSAVAYHAGRSKSEREKAQEQWVTGDARVVVATNAFGMGIDKPDVRFVIHAMLPSSIEAYYQEAGRAGRDGGTAYAVLLYHPADESTQEALIQDSHPTGPEVRQAYEAICNLGQVPVATLPEDPLLLSMERLQRLTEFSPGKLRTALELLERQEVLEHIPPRRYHGYVRFRKPVDKLRAYARSLDNKSLSDFVQNVLRAVHADAYRKWWPVDLRWLCQRTGLERSRAERGMAFLEERGLLTWHPPADLLRIQLTIPRAQKLPVDGRSIEEDRRRAERRLTYMRQYARSVTCRRQFLLGFFGENHADHCNACDICLGRHATTSVSPKYEHHLTRILRCIQEGFERPQWNVSLPPYRVTGLVQYLVEQGYVEVVNPIHEEYRLTSRAHAHLRDPVDGS